MSKQLDIKVERGVYIVSYMNVHLSCTGVVSFRKNAFVQLCKS